jgi:hypothetical protein
MASHAVGLADVRNTPGSDDRQVNWLRKGLLLLTHRCLPGPVRGSVRLRNKRNTNEALPQTDELYGSSRLL